MQSRIQPLAFVAHDGVKMWPALVPCNIHNLKERKTVTVRAVVEARPNNQCPTKVASRVPLLPATKHSPHYAFLLFGVRISSRASNYRWSG